MTMVHPHLKNAPILEALLDIRTVPVANYTPERLRAFHERLRDFLPQYEEVFQVEAQFQVGQNAPVAATEKKTQCARLKAADGNFISFVQPIGVNLSKMQPYSHWEDLRERAKAVWDAYRAEFAPQAVTRLALRYINRIELTPGQRIEDSFKTYPQLSEKLPQLLAQYRLQLVLPSADAQNMAIVNQIFDPNLSPGVLSIVFDIDAYRMVNLVPDSEKIWEIFEILHTFKNNIFFESLTDSARKKYE